MKKVPAVLVGLTVLLTTLVSPQALLAMDPQEQRQSRPNPSYRLTFAVDEVKDGKRINTRNYTMLLVNETKGRIRASSSVPVLYGNKEKAVKYMDVGFRLDCALREEGALLRLDTNVEMESFIAGAGTTGQVEDMPVLRNLSAQVSALVTPGKPTVIAQVDDSTSDRRFDLEVTATRLN